MQYKERIPDELFKQDGHYLGRPADFNDRIIQRRLNLVNKINNFIGSDFTLLDIGCGNGASMLELSKRMKYCLGLEISTEHLEEFEKIRDEKRITNCDYTILDIENNTLPMQFDRIISFEVIEHLENEKSVKFYFESLKPGGMIAITVPNKWWIFETHGARLPLLPWNRVPFFSWLPRSIHEKYANARIYTQKRIVNLLKSHGFDIESVCYITAPMDIIPQGKFKDFMIKYFFNSDTTTVPFKSTSIFVVAKKN